MQTPAKAKTTEEKEIPIEEMKLESYSDYIRYNRRVREENKKLRKHEYDIRQIPEELHPKETVVFTRRDQPQNPLPVYISDEMIEFKKTLIPNKTYELPRYVIKKLASKGTDIWSKIEKPDGSVDSVVTGKDYRFAFRQKYEE